MTDLELRIAIRKLDTGASLARILDQLVVITGDMIDECGDRDNVARCVGVRAALKVARALCES